MATNPRDAQWHSDISQALIVDNEQDITWQDEAEVIVLGFGGAGACAALEAVEQGASVIAIERFAGGGDTALSGGVVYAGGGTQFQKQANIEDDAQNMYQYLQRETEGVVQPETLKRFCEQSSDNIDWLLTQGVQFNANVSPVKTSYPQKEYFLYYSGNESVPAYQAHAKAAARGHRSVGKKLSGAAFYQPLKESALKKGVKLYSQSRVVRMVLDANNKLLGVEVSALKPSYKKQHEQWHDKVDKWRNYLPGYSASLRKKVIELEAKHSDKIFIRAKKGVIISAGGFIGNRKMLSHYAPKYKKGMVLGTTGTDGSGIRLGQTVGGATDRMSQISAWRFINPPIAWSQGIVVNKQGQRYVNEQCYGAVIGREMCEHHDGKSYVILNKKLYRKALAQALPGKIWSFQSLPAYLCMLFSTKKADSVKALAQKLSMPAENLQAEIDAYALAAKGQQEDSQGKHSDFIDDISEGPYYALNISIGNPWFPLPTITLGGLVVDELTGEVKNSDGENISGLYAAGRSAIGIASNMYVSGLSIADCVFSGRRAGNHLANKS